jgi:hypothetical protein
MAVAAAVIRAEAADAGGAVVVVTGLEAVAAVQETAVRNTNAATGICMIWHG